MRGFLLGVLAAAACNGGAFAQAGLPMPMRDSRAYCERLASKYPTLRPGETAEGNLQRCFDMEHNSYVQVQAEWNKLGRAKQSECLDMLRAASDYGYFNIERLCLPR